MGVHVNGIPEESIKTLCSAVRARLPDDDAETVCVLVEKGVAVIPYRRKDNNVVPALSEYRQWLKHELDKEMLEWLAEQWQNAKVVSGWGILLGPPSGYTIMLDIDSDDLLTLWEKDKYEWRRLAEYVVEVVASSIYHVNRICKLRVEHAAILVLSRRGGHIIYRLDSGDWKLLHTAVKANKMLGETELNLYNIANVKAKIELRTLGATPLSSFKHKVTHIPAKLTSLPLDRLADGLKNHGLELKLPTPMHDSHTSTKPAQAPPQHVNTQQNPPFNNINKDNSTRETPPPATGKLSEQNLAKIVDLLKNYWVKGHRNNIELALIGWLIKRRVPQEQAEELIRRIAEVSGDEEVSKRVDEVRRQYQLVQSGQKQVQELLGKAGLLQELQAVIKEQNPGITDEEARDRALAVIHELEKILGPRRSIILSTPYETGNYFVNDPARGIVLLKEKRDESGEVRRYRKYISDWYVRRVLIVRGDGQYLYKVLFRNARTREKLVLSGQLDEIVKELKRLHGVKRSQHLGDAVSAVISEFIRRKMAKVKKTAAVAGILPHKDGVKLVRVGALSKLLVPKEPDVEKARQALQLLEQLREHYDKAKFDVVINWAGYAVASYALKKLYHVKQVYLLMFGEKQTGKTTLARIITVMFPIVTAEEEEIPEEGQSEYRLAWKLNVAAVPLLEDEVQGISRKPSLLGLLKRASTGDTVRWRGDQNRRYHARAPLVFTSNYTELIEDPALVERIISVEFTQNDYVFKKSREEREEFRRLYNEYRAIAHHLGATILETIVEHWQDIASQWSHRLQEKSDYLELGQWLWKQVAAKLQVPEPPWTSTQILLVEERPEHYVEEIFWETLEDAVRQAMLKGGVAEDDTTLGMWGLLNKLAQQNLLPSWLKVKFAELVVLPGVMQELQKRGADVPSLRRLADLLGFEYKVVRVGNRLAKAMIVPKSMLVDRLTNKLALEEEREIIDRVVKLVEDGEITEYEIESYLVENGLKPGQASDIADKVRRILATQHAQKRAETAPA